MASLAANKRGHSTTRYAHSRSRFLGCNEAAVMHNSHLINAVPVLQELLVYG